MAKTRQGRRTANDDVSDKTPVEPSAPADTAVTIRARNGDEMLVAHLPRSEKFAPLAREWSYILRQRQRWGNDENLREDFYKRAGDDLKVLGVSQEFIQRVASIVQVEAIEQQDADTPVYCVEVELHQWNSSDDEINKIHEAAAEMPWEYLITSATLYEGRFHPLVITRLLRPSPPASPPTSQPTSPPVLTHLLFVESAPGWLQDKYEFDSERERIAAAIQADGSHKRSMQILKTPQLTELNDVVRSRHWEAIHISGVDNHQVTQFIENFYRDDKKDDETKDDEIKNAAFRQKILDSPDRVRDGMILRGSNELPVGYDELAGALIDPGKPPYLVTLNLYHSGARTARELVKRGAHAAVGFLDEIDDEQAELFFQAFYLAWSRPGRVPPISRALGEAWQKMNIDLHGTGIAIWTGQSVFEEPEPDSSVESRRLARIDKRRARNVRRGVSPISDQLQVEFEIDDEINYSLLHNDHPLANKLTLTKLVKEPLYDIKILIELYLGADNYPFRYTRLVFDEPQLILGPEIKIPLTAALPRSLRERVASTVYIKVSCGERTAYEETQRVTLLPVDEWLDDGALNPWLPSFVLPRDPAILKIISASRRYLVGIKDDPAAGFDGYQSADDDADEDADNADNGGADKTDTGVDAQVKAIWTALVNEFRLQYINPPPAYSKQTQRLRTPSDIIGSNTGTCIDLALLLASCLEYIDIYPVIVLLEGHAFVGYWRSREAHDDFITLQNIPATVPAVGSRIARQAEVPYVEKYGWYLSSLNYDEILSYVTAGDLVLLEATFLTRASSFKDAMDEGRANLRDRTEFESLLDVKLARSATPPITPLPIIDE